MAGHLIPFLPRPEKSILCTTLHNHHHRYRLRSRLRALNPSYRSYHFHLQPGRFNTFLQAVHYDIIFLSFS